MALTQEMIPDYFPLLTDIDNLFIGEASDEENPDKLWLIQWAEKTALLAMALGKQDVRQQLIKMLLNDKEPLQDIIRRLEHQAPESDSITHFFNTYTRFYQALHDEPLAAQQPGSAAEEAQLSQIDKTTEAANTEPASADEDNYPDDDLDTFYLEALFEDD